MEPASEATLKLSDLPVDLKFILLERCGDIDPVSIIALSQTCQSFRSVSGSEYGQSILFKALMAGTSLQSRLVYKIIKLRWKKRRWEELVNEGREPPPQQSQSESGPDPGYQKYPLGTAVQNYQPVSHERRQDLIKDLSKLQTTVRYFTKRFRATDFKANGIVDIASEKYILKHLGEFADITGSQC
ncbi:hypothetical protein TWF481_005592 [Arthrobotrys musiformis]|uniref:F-box domain-containing protein n=1 Tax=Arthrobotrys musiformis TaxID=47236 RepID=A0AAV9WEC7_9PEZI